MNKTYPSISVAIATFNSGKTIGKCLKLIRSQNYPQDKIEIILGDGGSKDNTKNIAKKYKTKIIDIPEDKQHAEYNRGVAFNEGKGEFSLILDHDNFMPTKYWLREMVGPLINHPEMVATTTCYYRYDKKAPLMDRYYGLYGTNEPLPYFLKKADRIPQTAKSWVGKGEAKDMGNYYLVKFEKNPREIPSIGTNGTLMRSRIVKKYANVKPEDHYPIDVMVDVVFAGYNTFGFVKNSLIHSYGEQGLYEFISRRKMFAEHYHFKDFKKRRWSVVMPGDGPMIFVFVIYSMTIIFPLMDSIRGFLKIRDVAWFVYPFMCVATTLIYGWVTVKYAIKGLFKI